VSIKLPQLPDRQRLAELSREAAAREQVQPDLAEKDFYLTRLLWVLGAELKDSILLKGGTLLSKVDLGFFRMSEDADLVMPGSPSHVRGSNVRRLNQVRAVLKAASSPIGVALPIPTGNIYEKGSHIIWDLPYESDFGPQAIKLEVSIRPTARPPRRVRLQQLLADPLLGDYRPAFCWALEADEARAEKIRAACTREAIRDFYDLDRLLDAEADFTSKGFLALVDAKLAELDSPPLSEFPEPFGLTLERLRKLRRAQQIDLPGVLRKSAPPFDLDRTVARFAELWEKRPS
jgi:hypothetical protein